MKIPRLADDGDDRRLSSHQGFHAWVIFGTDATAASHPESADLGALQIEFSDSFKEGYILFIG